MGLTISFSTLLPTSQPHKVVVVLIFRNLEIVIFYSNLLKDNDTP